MTVPSFAGGTTVNLELPCSFDFNLAATKYFHALEAGEIPITVMFSGTVFYAESDGRLQVDADSVGPRSIVSRCPSPSGKR